MELLLSQIINGLSVSAILFITSIGLVIILGMLGVVNLANGELIMIGAYMAYIATGVLKLPYIFALLLAFTVTACIGIFIETILIKRLYGKIAETLLVTFGLSYIFQQIVRWIFGPEDKFVDLPIKASMEMGSITVPVYNLFLIFMAVVILLATAALFYKTSLGMKIRAITQNRSMSQCLGIDTARIDTITFALGAGLSGLGGALIAPVKGVTPQMGIYYVTDSLLTVVLGGLNSIFGAFSSGYVIGESVTVMAGYMSEVTAKILVFLIVVVIIRLKPEGLFSSKDRR